MTNGWGKYEKLVLFEMRENGKRFEKIFNAISDLQTDVGGLKVKATIAGGIAGLVGTGILSAIIKLWR